MMQDAALARQILRLRERDSETRARLAATGALFDGYSPEMEQVHVENATELAAIAAERGWPGEPLVGSEAAEAAWLVAQHAISRPDLQRRFLALLEAAVATGAAPPRHLAYLTDRVRVNAGSPQIYGTVHDWDEAGEISPCPIEAPDGVDERRHVAGLPPLAATTARLRAQARQEGERAPASFPQRRAEQLQWARRVGWVP